MTNEEINDATTYRMNAQLAMNIMAYPEVHGNDIVEQARLLLAAALKKLNV